MAGPGAGQKTAARRRRTPATKKQPSSLEAAIAKVKKDYDLDFGVLEEIERFPTGNVGLDYVLGGGFPKGKIVEVYGLQSSGKTTSVLQLAAKLQGEGKHIVFLDYEQSLDPIYCKTLGLNILDESTFHVSQPDTFEQGMNALSELVKTGEIALVIIDSVAAMVIEREMDSEAGEGVGAMQKARLMAQELRKFGPLLREHGTCVVFLNHVRDVIDMSPMGQRLLSAGVQRKTTPGGSALKFHASVRLFFKVKKQVTADRWEALANEQVRTPIGAYVEVKAEKNKVSMPYRKAELYMEFGKGFSAAYGVLQVLLAHGSIKKKSGGLYEFDEDTSWEGIDTVRGEANVIDAIEERPEWLEHLAALATRVLAESAEFETPAAEEEDEDPEKDPLAPAETTDAELAELLG